MTKKPVMTSEVYGPTAGYRRTVAPSPREQAGLRKPASRGLCVGDWMKLNCGDVVREKEGRHLWRVDRINWSATVDVTSLEPGQRKLHATFELGELVRHVEGE